MTSHLNPSPAQASLPKQDMATSRKQIKITVEVNYYQHLHSPPATTISCSYSTTGREERYTMTTSPGLAGSSPPGAAVASCSVAATGGMPHPARRRRLQADHTCLARPPWVCPRCPRHSSSPSPLPRPWRLPGSGRALIGPWPGWRSRRP